MSDFSVRLRELRTNRGLRQADLAQAVGVAQATIANYEKKARFPDELMLGRLADFFAVSLDSLMGRSSPDRGSDDERTVFVGGAKPPSLSGDAAQYLRLVRRHQTGKAAELLESAIRRGVSLGSLYRDVLEPALQETGRLWEQGDLAVGEEHLISCETQRIMSRVFPSAAISTSPRHSRCLVLATMREEHVIGAAMVADLLRLDGWDVAFLGGNLGIRHVREMINGFGPKLVAVSVTMSANVSGAADLISVLRARDGFEPLQIIVGGKAMGNDPTLWRKVGADATAADAVSAVATANALFRAARTGGRV